MICSSFGLLIVIAFFREHLQVSLQTSSGYFVDLRLPIKAATKAPATNPTATLAAMIHGSRLFGSGFGLGCCVGVGSMDGVTVGNGDAGCSAAGFSGSHTM